MTNHLARIGAILMDLESLVIFEDHDSSIDFLDQEFTGISLALGYTAMKKELGWAYQMDFHKRESLYLLAFAKAGQFKYSSLDEQAGDVKFLLGVYHALSKNLETLLKRIDMLVTSKNLNLGQAEQIVN